MKRIIITSAKRFAKWFRVSQFSAFGVSDYCIVCTVFIRATARKGQSPKCGEEVIEITEEKLIMKCNEKNMIAFATSATPVDREGWLNKRGEVNRAYQRRWFVLKGNILFYFDRRGDKEPVGMIVLEGCTIELAEEEEQFGFKIVFHGPNNRSYILGAESQESMEQWMKALACASYDYMKLMVAELQRQLDAVEEETTITPSVELPTAPPRLRHNPFNRVESHHRSQSVRSAPGRTENIPRTKVSFKELHNTYGRRILQDLNEWRHAKRLSETPLIDL